MPDYELVIDDDFKIDLNAVKNVDEEIICIDICKETKNVLLLLKSDSYSESQLKVVLLDVTSKKINTTFIDPSINRLAFFTEGFIAGFHKCWDGNLIRVKLFDRSFKEILNVPSKYSDVFSFIESSILLHADASNRRINCVYIDAQGTDPNPGIKISVSATYDELVPAELKLEVTKIHHIHAISDNEIAILGSTKTDAFIRFGRIKDSRLIFNDFFKIALPYSSRPRFNMSQLPDGGLGLIHYYVEEDYEAGRKKYEEAVAESERIAALPEDPELGWPAMPCIIDTIFPVCTNHQSLWRFEKNPMTQQWRLLDHTQRTHPSCQSDIEMPFPFSYLEKEDGLEIIDLLTERTISSPLVTSETQSVVIRDLRANNKFYFFEQGTCTAVTVGKDKNKIINEMKKVPELTFFPPDLLPLITTYCEPVVFKPKLSS